MFISFFRRVTLLTCTLWIAILFLFCGQLSTNLDSSDLKGNWEHIATTTKWNNNTFWYKDWEIYFIGDNTLEQYVAVPDTIHHYHLNYIVNNDSIYKYPPGSIYGTAYKISFQNDTLFFNDSLFLHKFIRYNSESFPVSWEGYHLIDYKK